MRLGRLALLALLAGCDAHTGDPVTTSAAELVTDAGDPRYFPAYCCARNAPTADADPTERERYRAYPSVEPCWDHNAAGNYARWTCATGWCADNGRTCVLGGACVLEDTGYPGTVRLCDYPWYP